MSNHYHYGSGSYGCLYDNGPSEPMTLESAVESLVDLFTLTVKQEDELNHNLILDLSPRRHGAEYCEIFGCNDDCLAESNFE